MTSPASLRFTAARIKAETRPGYPLLVAMASDTAEVRARRTLRAALSAPQSPEQVDRALHTLSELPCVKEDTMEVLMQAGRSAHLSSAQCDEVVLLATQHCPAAVQNMLAAGETDAAIQLLE